MGWPGSTSSSDRTATPSPSSTRRMMEMSVRAGCDRKTERRTVLLARRTHVPTPKDQPSPHLTTWRRPFPYPYCATERKTLCWGERRCPRCYCCACRSTGGRQPPPHTTIGCGRLRHWRSLLRSRVSGRVHVASRNHAHAVALAGSCPQSWREGKSTGLSGSMPTPLGPVIY
jgi:hypothetical protein